MGTTPRREKPANTARSDGASRVRKHREKMKTQGLKPVTIWVPDVNEPGYQERVDRSIAIINASAEEKQILEELSHIEIEGWK